MNDDDDGNSRPFVPLPGSRQASRMNQPTVHLEVDGLHGNTQRMKRERERERIYFGSNCLFEASDGRERKKI